ncbi:unnamed protein product [Bursaphelenchus xylophilus]|uniref:(pine wood nematode) hypothetical protein n=1 Tax=Bursaphelenchus xylophilus TaxID=6326 RepID=A0A1I7RKB1_BURXY|nr:unnamed protein product [Bursaphelenchus xylophilus]CAG9131395.1 unnamed protein product [Bursaphelenchus xylophilus]
MAKSLAKLLRIQDWKKTLNIIAGGHAILHLIFLGLEIYSGHYYGVIGSLFGIAASAALFYGNRREIPYLFLPYLICNLVLIVAWLGAGLYLIVEAAECIPEEEQVHTLLKFQSPVVGIVMGSLEIVISILQIIPLILVYEAANLLRKDCLYN